LLGAGLSMDERSLRVLEFPKIRDRLVALTVTAVGREIGSALLPSTDSPSVRRTLEETSEAVALLNEGEVPLRGTVDIREMVRKADIGSIPAATDFLALKDTLATIRQCRGFILVRREKAPLIAETVRTVATFEPLEEAIARTIAPDGSIPDSASSTLAATRREQRATQNRLRDKLDELIRGPYARMLQDPLIMTRGDRYVLPVKQEHKGQFPGVLHDQSSSGATAFMEPLAVVPIGNRLRELEIAERDEIARLLHELATRVAASSAEVLRAYDAIGHVDFAVAKARLAEQMDAARPKIRDDGVLRMNQARHPLLTGDIVPIDILLGEDFAVLIITGPNTGGKTVTLKTIGLLTLMAQAGLFIPSEEGSEASVFPRVFADIGDEQSIEQSLSTFSSHMSAIVSILRQLKPPALVLLDEIGAGTDPTEGVALARALIEHLQTRGVRTAVTTHYNELKALASTHPGIQNASVEFDVQTLRPTYRLLIGIPGRSNALTIAGRLGLDPGIIERAKSLVGEEIMAIDRVLSDIEADRRAYEYELAQAARQRVEAESLRARSEQELTRLRTDRQKTLARVREEGEALVSRARKEIEAILDALKSTPSRAQIQSAKTQLQQLAQDLEGFTGANKEAPPGQPVESVHPGQTVFVVPLGTSGTIVGSSSQDDVVEVEVGAMRVKARRRELRTVVGRESVPQSYPQPERTRSEPPANIPVSISIRGQRVEEAIPTVDKYLDDAFLAGVERVTVVHGKGTGALRKAVHDFLTGHPHVRSFRLGERNEGDAGATVVELKEK